MYLIQILANHPSNPDIDIVVDGKSFLHWDDACDWAVRVGDAGCSVQYFHDKGGSSWHRMVKADFDAIARQFEEA